MERGSLFCNSRIVSIVKFIQQEWRIEYFIN